MLLAASLVLFGAWTGVGAAEAAAPRAGLTSADSRRVSLSGTTFASATNENVDVVGTLQVATVLLGSEQTGWILGWATGLGNITGTGQTTGDRYRATGTDGGFVPMPSGPPAQSVAFEPSCRLYSPGLSVHPPSPCRFIVNLVFDGSGRVTDVAIQVDPGVIGPAD